MKSGKLTVGTAFLVIGVLLLGRTAGWFPAFSWAHLLRFWPVIFIALGLELIFPKGILAGSAVDRDCRNLCTQWASCTS